MPDGSANTNTIILLMVAGGLYYASNSTDSAKSEHDTDKSSTVPYVLALILVFSLKTEIQETVSKDRLYTLVAITAASYFITAGADMLQIFASIFASLIMLPAIQEYEKK